MGIQERLESTETNSKIDVLRYVLIWSEWIQFTDDNTENTSRSTYKWTTTVSRLHRGGNLYYSPVVSWSSKSRNDPIRHGGITTQFTPIGIADYHYGFPDLRSSRPTQGCPISWFFRRCEKCQIRCFIRSKPRNSRYGSCSRSSNITTPIHDMGIGYDVPF